MSNILHYIKKLRPYNIKKGLMYLKHYGPKEFMVRLSERMEPEEVPYGPWYEKHKAGASVLEKQRRHVWKEHPLISIAVPVYHTPKKYFEEMASSVMDQSYPYWELCIVNASPDDEELNGLLKEYSSKDSRIKIRTLSENGGIGKNTNAAIEMAEGDYVGLLDHDDVIAPDALYEIASAIVKNDSDLLYTDEDKIDESGKEHYQPHLKPDFSPDLLRSNNYICHFLVIRKKLLDKTGGFREGYDGAQDHDLIFRCTEQAEVITHIPRILYHWRTHKTSTADNPASKLYAYEAGKRAIEGNLERTGTKGVVSSTKDFGFFRVDYPLTEHPLVSIIIPNRNSADILKVCLESIFEKSTYDNYEIIIAENNSTEDSVFEYYKELEKEKKARVVVRNEGFNFSAINNFAVGYAKGDYLLFMNNDIEVKTPTFIEDMLGNCMRKEVGITGCKLYYPDGTIQHAGTIIGIGGIAGHAFLGMDGKKSGYLHKASIQLNYSAVTAACMMMKRSAFEEAGGFEEKLTVAFNDVDLCLRVVKNGLLVVYDPFVEMIHHESKSRGAEDTEEKVRRFQSEIEFMRTRWIKLLKEGDPYYNPNLTLSKWNYSLRI